MPRDPRGSIDQELISSKPKRLCPRCGKPGYGAYLKPVIGYKGRVYHYWYFAHPAPDKGPKGLRWCYLGKDPGPGVLPDPKPESCDVLRGDGHGKDA